MELFRIHTDKYGKLLIWNKHLLNTPKLLGIDLDHTFIKPASGAVFSKNADDWSLMYSEDDRNIATLQKYMQQDYSIVFMTNQKGLNTTDKLEEFKQKWTNVIAHLKSTHPDLHTNHWTLLASLSLDNYRKPAPGMWNFVGRELMHGGRKIVESESLYVGDAAGRPKDFSAADIMFSLNVGVEFMVPEIFFGVSHSKELQGAKLKQNIRKNKKYFQPDKFLAEYHSKSMGVELPDLEVIQNAHLVVMVGAQASGKSTFCREHLQKYVHMSNDTFGGTPTAFKKELEALLRAGKYVVVDNTNPTVEVRGKWLSIARKVGVSSAMVYMQATDNRLYVEHMLKLRDMLGIQHVPIIALRTFYKKLEKPTNEEGFDALVKIPLILELELEKGSELGPKRHGIPEDAFSWWLD